MSQKLETRVRFLEDVLNNHLSKRNMSDENKIPDGSEDQEKIIDAGAPPVPVEQQPPTPGTDQQPPAPNEDHDLPEFKMVYPKYDIVHPQTGQIIRIDQQILIDNPDLLAWTQKLYPECFEK